MSWMKYLREVREEMPRYIEDHEVREIMDFYTTGKPVDACVSQLPLEAPEKPVEKKSVFREGSVAVQRKPRQKRT